MPKQNTSPMLDEELPPAAIAFMKNGSKQAKTTGATPSPASDNRLHTEPIVNTHAVQPTKRRRTSGNRDSSVRESATFAVDPPRRPFSTRLRTDLYVRLKEVSLMRELQRTPPFHMSEIVEQAIEAWLITEQT